MSGMKAEKEKLGPKPLNPRDLYYECITSCSLGDEGVECLTRCVEVHLKDELDS